MIGKQKNKLICGDNLEILPKIEGESIDLIYIDPPFLSKRNYEIIWGDDAEIRSFEDRWEGGINVYVDWMKQRVLELHRILKPTGIFYLHCDWHAGHYLKVMCDEIFKEKNFRNEIVLCYAGGGIPKKDFPRKHETIFRYSKTDNYTFNVEYRPYGNWIKTFKPRHSLTSGGGKLDTEKGTPINDWWADIPKLTSYHKEWTGYQTQKSEKLLERIIKTSSNEGDTILDAFCGCGTTLTAAHKLKRYWIGIDISPSAITLVRDRLKEIGVSEEEIDIIGMPETIEDLKKYKHYDFQYWVINELYGMPSPRKVRDMGIDGFSFLEHHPIQVKQSERVGRNVIDNFETALRRYYTHKTEDMKGYIVAFSFTKGAYEEVARVKKEGIDITLLKVQDILDKKIVMKIQEREDDNQEPYL